jgi:hypothetical protein
MSVPLAIIELNCMPVGLQLKKCDKLTTVINCLLCVLEALYSDSIKIIATRTKKSRPTVHGGARGTGGICPRVLSKWGRRKAPINFFKTISLTKALIKKQWRPHWSGHYIYVEKGGVRRGGCMRGARTTPLPSDAQNPLPRFCKLIL